MLNYRLCPKACEEPLCHGMQQELRQFNFVTQEDAAEVTSFFSCQKTAAGEILWREGEASDTVYFIVNGTMELTKNTDFSRRQVVVGVYGRGAIMGESALFNGARHATTATAQTDLDLIVLPREAFESLAQRYPDMGLNLTRGLLQAVATRLRKSYDRLAAIF